MVCSRFEAASVLHRSVLLWWVGVGQTVNLFRSSSFLPGPKLRPRCACWQAGHVAHIHSINVLLASFLTSWMLGSDRCTGRPSWRSVWLFGRLGLSIWQDLPSHDGWWLEHRKGKGKRERKVTVLHHGGL